MKSTVITSIIVAICLLIIPFFGFKSGQTATPTAAGAPTVSYYAESVKEQTPRQSGSFRIKTEEKIVEIGADDYIFGVVAAEMSASAPAEALKAQCVAAYSFALYRQSVRANEEYDLTDSYKTDQSYLSEEKLRERWGEKYGEYASAVRAAVNAVSGEYLSYGGAPALALYHSLSSGRTNSCEEVFGGAKPYLIPVESECDRLSPDYKSVFSFSSDELKEKMSSVCKSDAKDNLFSDVKKSSSGLVLSLNCGGVTLSGSKTAALLTLPSAAFDVEYESGAYTFTCLGRGHGVGMSQYGAQYLAAGGSTYKEILAHYYPGCEIRKV
ncbi:MAG: stage II sporulation protein D [Clostridia bacterium]|nr:stage II sporulation protein D [Clostridia bacterium]